MNTNLSDSPETPNSGQNRQFIVPCDIEIGNITFKNNRAPLIRASLHRHMCIQSGVIVCKRLNEVLTAVTFTFDLLLPWPFAWPSLLSMAITPEKFMMMRWWKQNGVTVYGRQADGRMNGQTDWTSYRAAWSQLKTQKSDKWPHCFMYQARFEYNFSDKSQGHTHTRRFSECKNSSEYLLHT